MLFDGKAFAREIESRVTDRVAKLPKQPKIISILVGEDPASELYTRLKKSAALRCGIDFEVIKLSVGSKTPEIVSEIQKAAKRAQGIMIQLPLLRQGSGGQAIPYSRAETEEALRVIPLDKDVDGLRWEESGVMPATVRAILSILEKIDTNWREKFVVVGGTGSIGRPLVHFLKSRYHVEAEVANSKTKDLASVTRAAEVLISCVGKEGLITAEMVREGVITIDVGAPKGDMTPEVYLKAKQATPVPGGVGPVTVASLMQNVLDMVQSRG